MGAERFEQLRPRERECLRLVLTHRSSKLIARELKLSPNSVRVYINSALEKLEVSSREEAAHLLAIHERREPYPPGIYPPIALDPSPERTIVPPSVEPPDGSPETPEASVPIGWRAHLVGLLISIAAYQMERRNDLTAIERAGIILRMMLVAISTLALVAALGTGIAYIGWMMSGHAP